jgi:hypothetical protein
MTQNLCEYTKYDTILAYAENFKELAKVLLQIIKDNQTILNASFITLSLDAVDIKRLKQGDSFFAVSF